MREFLSAKKAAEYLGVGIHKLDELTRERKLTVYQDHPGCRRKYERADLDVYMDSIRREPPKVNPYGTYRKRRGVSA